MKTAFNIFSRRLNNKDDDGTAVITRYTYRVLTTQQFERSAALIVSCDLIRQRHQDILGEKITTCSLPNGFNSKIVREKAFQEGLLYLFTSQPTLKVRGDNSFYIIGRYPVQAHHKNKYIASLSKRNFPTLIKHNILWSIKSVLRSLGGDTYLLFRKKILSRRK